MHNKLGKKCMHFDKEQICLGLFVFSIAWSCVPEVASFFIVACLFVCLFGFLSWF